MTDTENHTGRLSSKRPPRSHRRIWLGTTFLSLLVHFALAPMLDRLATDPSPSTQQPPAYRSMPLLSQEQVRSLTRVRPKQARKKSIAPLPKPPSPPESARGQIIEIPPPRKEAKPDEARFVSDYNSKVEREQVSARNEAPTPDMTRSKQLRLSGGKKADERLRSPQQAAKTDTRKKRKRE